MGVRWKSELWSIWFSSSKQPSQVPAQLAGASGLVCIYPHPLINPSVSLGEWLLASASGEPNVVPPPPEKRGRDQINYLCFLEEGIKKIKACLVGLMVLTRTGRSNEEDFL